MGWERYITYVFPFVCHRNIYLSLFYAHTLCHQDQQKTNLSIEAEPTPSSSPPQPSPAPGRLYATGKNKTGDVMLTPTTSRHIGQVSQVPNLSCYDGNTDGSAGGGV